MFYEYLKWIPYGFFYIFLGFFILMPLIISLGICLQIFSFYLSIKINQSKQKLSEIEREKYCSKNIYQEIKETKN